MTRMREEIGEIPAVVERLLREDRPSLHEAAEAVRAAAPRFAVIAARGTSDNAGRYGRYLIETHLGMPTGLAAASVITTYHATLRWDGVLVIGLSQSGQSPDICAIVEDARHAGATTIAVRLREHCPAGGKACGGALLEVVDDGAGFDPAAVRRAGRSLGLVSMRDRATSVRGRLDVASAPGEGTTIRLEVDRGRAS